MWFWTLRRGFSWFSLQAGLVAPIFMAELALAHPSYRQNLATMALLYIVAGAIPLVISLPLAVRYRYWRSMLWMPTWFAFAFLRRLATLEAAISLPARPFPAPAAARSPQRSRNAFPGLRIPWPRQMGPAGAPVTADPANPRDLPSQQTACSTSRSYGWLWSWPPGSLGRLQAKRQ